MSKTTYQALRLIFFIVLLWFVVSYPMLIGYSIGAARVYLEYRLEGLSHAAALCEVTEFTDNILRNVGFSDRAARQTQRELYREHCVGE